MIDKLNLLIDNLCKREGESSLLQGGEKEKQASISELLNALKPFFSTPLDLRKEEDLTASEKLADYFLALDLPILYLRELELSLAKEKNLYPLVLHLSIKLAISKLEINQIKKPLTLSVIFAVYKEHIRILPSTEHENGEDFLRIKIRQIKWLFSAKTKTQVSWKIYIVDDGCPETSGTRAEEQIQKNNLGEFAEVLYLQNAIDNKLAIVKGVHSTADSQKGASIQYGLYYAASKMAKKAESTKLENHILVYTDADLSTHLGQLGLLVSSIINQNKDCAIASRREESSIVIKKGLRNDRGKLFIYLWKRLLPNINDIVDTQCGFKAFRAETVLDIIDDLLERKFAFDIELLLKTQIRKANSISKVAIAWIDSDALSTTTDLAPYLSMLKSTVRMYKHYLSENILAEEFATFILSLNEESWEKLLRNIPEEIVARNPADFSTFNKIQANDLAVLCGLDA